MPTLRENFSKLNSALNLDMIPEDIKDDLNDALENALYYVDVVDTIKEYIREGKKIEAIKVFRLFTGLSLKASKYFVDAVEKMEAEKC